MNLLEAKEILEKIDFFEKLVNQTIGILGVTLSVKDKYKVDIKVFKKINKSVATFLLSRFEDYLIQQDETYKITSQLQGLAEEKISTTITYYLDKDAVEINERIINHLITALYFAVNEAKVEYELKIQKDFRHQIPDDIYWQLDEWNDGWLEEDELEKCSSDEEIKIYKIPINCLYGISLGYYDICLDNLESDAIPELIGVLLATTEDFSYATAWEDKYYIYLYTVVELDDDNILDIEEGIFKILSVLSEENADFITLEEAYNSIQKEENDE